MGARALAKMPVPDATSKAFVSLDTWPTCSRTQPIISLLSRFIRWFHRFSKTAACFVNSFWITQILSLVKLLRPWLLLCLRIQLKICPCVARLLNSAIAKWFNTEELYRLLDCTTDRFSLHIFAKRWNCWVVSTNIPIHAKGMALQLERVNDLPLRGT